VPPQRLFYFVEMDLGTEPSKTLASKCRLYVRYWQSGGFARDFNVPVQVGFRTLFIAPTPARLATILQVIRNLEHGRSMFWVTTAECIQPEQVLRPVFQSGTMPEKAAVQESAARQGQAPKHDGAASGMCSLIG
jgi:hypothetical protein